LSVLLVEEVIRRSTEATEVGLGTDPVAAERFAITQLLDIAQPAGDTTVAVCVERVERQGHAGVAAGIHLGAVEDRGHVLVDNLRWGKAVGVDEEAVCVGFVVALTDSNAVASLGERVSFKDLPERVREVVTSRLPGQERA